MIFNLEKSLHASRSASFGAKAPFGLLVRSLSVKNWQDRDKADKVTISFPATPKNKLKYFWGCNEDIRKIYHPG